MSHDWDNSIQLFHTVLLMQQSKLSCHDTAHLFQISELSNKVNKLSEGLEAAPEIRNIPDKLLTVSKVKYTASKVNKLSEG